MLMRGLVDLFAQYERALIRSRTKAALAVKKGRGERLAKGRRGHVGGAPMCSHGLDAAD
jgi:DNA invertase Pin-like site-specific DNA recombinase